MVYLAANDNLCDPELVCFLYALLDEIYYKEHSDLKIRVKSSTQKTSNSGCLSMRETRPLGY